MVILVAVEAIVPFDFNKTNKKHLRNKTQHKRNKNIFWGYNISRNDCKKEKKNGDNNGHGTCCKVILPWLEVHLSVL